MARLYQLVAQLGSVTDMPQDIAENVVHVIDSNNPVNLPTVANLLTRMRDFYLLTAPGATQDVGNYIGASISRTANKCAVLAYTTDDFTGATPLGSPVGQIQFTMSPAAAGNALPEEVAVCISVNADLTDVPVSEVNPTPPPATIRPQQRRRGRLYIGPLGSSLLSSSGGLARPSSAARTDLGLAFKALAEGINTDEPTCQVGVWSRADAEVWPIIEGYVDDAWDTQRRRGVEATLRTSFSIS